MDVIHCDTSINMIQLQPQFIQEDGEFVKLCASYGLNDQQYELWYKVPKKFKNFLVVENCDPFVVGLLFLGLKLGMDIRVEGKVSHRLLYSANHYLIPALCLANPKLQSIKIFAKQFNDKDLNEEGVSGTGLSCGIDSFSCYYDHIDEEDSYQIKFFTFFNAGSHGSGGEKTREIFRRRLNKAKKFATKVGKEIIPIDSNLSEVLDMKFQETNTLRNASCVLIFQKLFKNYYIASKNRFDYFELHAYDTQDYDALVLNLLSTESTTFFSAVAQLTRIERTALISNHPDTYESLDVCTSTGNYKNEVNCSKCNKCLRTALTLDLLGKLHLYDRVFHIERYKRLKYSYIWHLKIKKNKGQIEKDLLNLVKQKNEFRYYQIIKSKVNTGLGKIFKSRFS